MSKYYFNYKKYREWRKYKEKLDDEALDIIEEFNNYEQLDGKSFDELWQKGKIILKDWCDKVND